LFSFGPSKNDKYEQHIKHLNHPNLLSNALVGLGEALHVLLDQTVATQELDVGTVLLELALLAELDVLLTTDGGEAPVLGDNDLLATRELVGGAAHGLNGGGAVGVTGADGQEDLADVHTGDNTVGLTEGTTHTGLETIGTSARQHLVDTDDVEGVGADTQVETFLTGDLDEVLVGTDTGSFESFGGKLFVFVGDHVDAQGEVVHGSLLTTQVEDTDLGVGNTTVEPGLRVRLVLAVAVTSRGTTGHFDGISEGRLGWLVGERGWRRRGRRYQAALAQMVPRLL
jgi:hypothetical protein